MGFSMATAFDRRQILLYGVLPALVVGTLIAMYFSGVPWMRQFVAPDYQREYGAAENLQNLILIAMVILAVRKGRRESERRIRLCWFAIAAFAMLVLMEEIDWGYYYYLSLTGQPRHRHWEDTFNLHNQGGAAQWTMHVVDGVLIAGFGVLPVLVHFFPRTFHRLRPLTPSPYSILTLLVIVVTGHVAHYLDDTLAPPKGALHGNISEFREITTYWLALLYLGTVGTVPRNPAAN